VEHLALIEEVIQRFRFFDINLVHRFQTADFLQVFEDLTADVDRPTVGGVVERVIRVMDIVAQVGRDLLIQISADEIFADDDNRETGRTDILLNAAVNQTVVADVHRLGKEHGTLI